MQGHNSATNFSKWHAAIIFAVAMLAMVTLNTSIHWAHLHATLYEAGDFAANSLLIQKAKTFELLTGNYSRVGFNHPGPSILYVLAAGEWLFHDVLHWVTSPFAGQLLAVGFYNGMWLGLIGIVACVLLGRISHGLVLTALLLILTVHVDPEIIGGIWFPHLYYFPFLSFLLAMAGLCMGRWSVLPVAVLSGGFLVHGHVSFVAIAGIMFSSALIANYLMGRYFRSGTHPLFDRDAIRRHGLAIGASFLLCLVFLLPIALETVKNYPGPVAQYMAFGKSNLPNPWESVISFVAGFWGRNWMPLFFGMVALAIAVLASSSRAQKSESAGPTVCIALAVATATAAFLFYARVGIDNLTFQYVGIFYLATPVLTLSAVCIQSFSSRVPPKFQIIGTVLLLCLLPWSVDQAMAPSTYVSEFYRKETPAFATAVASLDHQPIALDPDKSEQWNILWSSLTAIAVLEKRQGKSTFCIARNWHILFTTALRCTPEQSVNRRHFAVSMVSDPPVFEAPDAVRIGNLLIYKPATLAVREGANLSVKNNADAFLGSILGQGWSDPSGGFVWSIGDTPQLHIKLNTRSEKVLTIDSEALLSTSHPNQTIEIFAGDQSLGALKYDYVQNRAYRSLPIPLQAIPQSGLLTLTLRPSLRLSPKQAGLSTDSRLLGMGLHGIRIESAPAPR